MLSRFDTILERPGQTGLRT